MFIEPKSGIGQSQKTGWIEVICGSMFSGKTEELIRRLNRAKIAKQSVTIFKPKLDTRYHAVDIVSHNQIAISSIPLDNSSQLMALAGECEVVGIDEAQFFDVGIINVANELANQGKRVLVAGLDMDSAGVPFGPMPALMSIAEYVTKVHAICVKCGDLAHYSHRTVANNEQVLLGETDSYEALCRKCYNL